MKTQMNISPISHAFHKFQNIENLAKLSPKLKIY